MLQLVGGRLVQGLGSGLMNTAVFVLVAQAYEVAQRPRMFTYISTAWVLPSFVGPPVSAWVTEQLSWHWVFFLVIPMVLGGGLLVLPTLRRLMRGYVRPAAATRTRRARSTVGGRSGRDRRRPLLQLAGQRLDWVALGAARRRLGRAGDRPAAADARLLQPGRRGPAGGDQQSAACWPGRSSAARRSCR